MEIIPTEKNEKKTSIEIQRTENNTRQRPNAGQRYVTNGANEDDNSQNKLKLINSKDLEWLAWNWRLRMNE